MGAYFRFLTERQAEVQVLFKDLLIGVTSFFRDPQAFEVLSKRVILRLLEQKQVDVPLRIWVPGCSTGEEAVSIAILMEEAIGRSNRHSDVQIFARNGIRMRSSMPARVNTREILLPMSRQSCWRSIL